MSAFEYPKDLLRRAGRAFWHMAKVMVPVMALVQLAEEYGISSMLGALLAPLMKLVGLPGEAGLVWAIALLTGFYGGVGALVALLMQIELSALQLNVLLSMILFAHAIPVEQSIVRAAGGSFIFTTLIRLIAAFVFGFILHHIGFYLDALQEPATLGLLPQASGQGGVWGFLRTTAKTLLLMFVVLSVLLAGLDFLKRIGVFERLTQWLTPFFTKLGIVPNLAPLVVVGMLLGLTYGGGLIVAETRKHRFTKRELFTPLASLSIIHALIEDTFVVIALGGDVWVILLWRTLFALLIIAVIGALVGAWPQKAIAESPRSL